MILDYQYFVPNEVLSMSVSLVCMDSNKLSKMKLCSNNKVRAYLPVCPFVSLSLPIGFMSDAQQRDALTIGGPFLRPMHRKTGLSIKSSGPRKKRPKNILMQGANFYFILFLQVNCWQKKFTKEANHEMRIFTFYFILITQRQVEK